MASQTGSLPLFGGLGLRPIRPSDQDFLLQLFIESRPWLSWADTDRDVLGLMMAGVPLDEAVAQAAEHRTTLGEADIEAGDAPSSAGVDVDLADADAREEEIQ